MSTGNSAAITALDIQLLLNDRPEVNKLLDEHEFDPDQIRAALNFTVDQWNGLPPDVGSLTIETWPPAWRYFLMIGAAAQLLRMAASSYRRNKLQYQLPGGAAQDNAREAEYMAAHAGMMAEFREWLKRQKKAINFNAGWGNV